MNNSLPLPSLPSCILKVVMNSVGLQTSHILISDPFFLFLRPQHESLEVTHNLQPFRKVGYACGDK